ncbi:unnamed protein product [Pleuronectes platessa]|uniref:Uncharacterized protein n=1 Tax=Pleuronectes platessa TaxID=8262 RepID=A0A9N7U5A5_PLEPL|nr:unnamed protein product [Pleuronectes platessa]
MNQTQATVRAHARALRLQQTPASGDDSSQDQHNPVLDATGLYAKRSRKGRRVPMRRYKDPATDHATRASLTIILLGEKVRRAIIRIMRNESKIKKKKQQLESSVTWYRIADLKIFFFMGTFANVRMGTYAIRE